MYLRPVNATIFVVCVPFLDAYVRWRVQKGTFCQSFWHLIPNIKLVCHVGIKKKFSLQSPNQHVRASAIVADRIAFNLTETCLNNLYIGKCIYFWTSNFGSSGLRQGVVSRLGCHWVEEGWCNLWTTKAKSVTCLLAFCEQLTRSGRCQMRSANNTIHSIN